MEYIECLLSKVPDVIWAAIIASILTFLGVLLTNKGNQKSLSMQLEHDKDKFVYEQEVSLKKEVFLEAASTFSQSLSAITKLANLGISMETINNELASHSPSAAKLYVTAKQETVKNAIEFSSELSATYLKLIKERAGLDDSKNAISIYQGYIDNSASEQQRILMIMKELNLHGVGDEKKWDYLNKSHKSETDNIDVNQKKIDDLNKSISPKHIEFSRKCISESARLTMLVTPLITSIRAELHTSEEKDELDEVFKTSMTKMQNTYDTFIKDITK